MQNIKKNFIREGVEFLAQVSLMATFFLIFIAQQYLVKGVSMEPTLHDGERLFVDKISYLFTKPGRGDIVVIKNEFPKRIIKRVIGLPGDVLYGQNGHLYINGEEYLEPYIKDTFNDFGVINLDSDEYYVLGDNRNNSKDSRVIGAIKKDRIVGRAFIRIFPIKGFGLLMKPKYEPISKPEPEMNGYGYGRGYGSGYGGYTP